METAQFCKIENSPIGEQLLKVALAVSLDLKQMLDTPIRGATALMATIIPHSRLFTDGLKVLFPLRPALDFGQNVKAHEFEDLDPQISFAGLHG